MPDLPPSLRALYEAAGPVIRYRVLRDVLGRDESYIETAHLGLDLARYPEIDALETAQRPDATWNGILCSPPLTGGQGGVGNSEQGGVESIPLASAGGIKGGAATSKSIEIDAEEYPPPRLRGSKRGSENVEGTKGTATPQPQTLPLTTESAFLRLCELGRETSPAVGECVEKVLLPTLFDEQVLWEFARDGMDDNYRRAARHIVRDKVLRLICRATREADAVIKPQLETVLAEWDLFLAAASPAVDLVPPTADAWAAVCWYPWTDDELERVHTLARRLFEYAETQLNTLLPVGEAATPKRVPLTGETVPPPRLRGGKRGSGTGGKRGTESQEIQETTEAPLFSSCLFRLHDKWEYLARPQLLLHDLELAARLGIVRDLEVTRWMLEELEAHQDADGMFSFEVEESVRADWYFPLEAHAADAFPREWTFRAALIFKLLEYDL